MLLFELRNALWLLGARPSEKPRALRRTICSFWQFHSCGSDKGASGCLDAAQLPSGGKPKKLANAYEACVKKAVGGKTCKAKCSQ